MGTLTKLYLDVDGLLIGRRDPARSEVCLANHALAFLSFVLERFACYWLTTRCRGEAGPVLEYLFWHAEEAQRPRLMELAARVRPTPFRTLKTEALPDEGRFLWIDDSPIFSEIAFLRERGWEDRWLQVDARREPEDLLRAMNRLDEHLRESGEHPPEA